MEKDRSSDLSEVLLTGYTSRPEKEMEGVVDIVIAASLCHFRSFVRVFKQNK